MSQYGPPGDGGNRPYGQPPDQPYQGVPGGFGGNPAGEQDPFSGRLPDPLGGGQPAGPPTGDPFGQQPPPSYMGPGGPGGPGGPAGPGGPMGQGGPGAPDGMAPWDGGAPKKSKAPLVIILVIVLLVVAGGGGAGWYFLFGPGKSDKQQTATKDHKSPAPGKSKGTDDGPAVSVQKGDCVVHPKNSQTVKPADCSTPDALKVYDRINGTTDKSKCPVPPTDFTYVFKDNKGSDNFVLCLQQQDGGNAASPTASS